jgi:hypothetical protein
LKFFRNYPKYLKVFTVCLRINNEKGHKKALAIVVIAFTKLSESPLAVSVEKPEKGLYY